MIDKLSDSCVKKLISNGMIESEDEELYLYGLRITITQTIFILFVLFLGIVFKCLIESVVFYIAFQTIRKYAGGYHASSPMVCNIFSTISLMICIVMLKNLIVYDDLTILVIITVISSISIIVLSPLDTPGKRLTEKEFIKYKKLSIIISIVVVVLIIVTYMFDMKGIYVSLCLSVLLESVLLISGKLKSLRE